MNMKSTVMAVAAILGAASAVAGPIPYPNPGTANPATYSFTASSSGPLDAYFLGSGASYDESLGLLVNGVDTGILGLDNHTTAVGTELSFGNVTAGDSLVFYIAVSTTGDTWYSNSALNSDGASHVYSTNYAGSGAIPAGTYLGFEDLPANISDFNYTDEQFSFTNVATVTTAVPEPTSAALLLVGLGLVGFVTARRRHGR